MVTVPALSDEVAINQYTATSGQTDFNFTFMIFSTADIDVYQEGTLKTINTHYTVKKSDGTTITSADLPLDGGKVVFVTGATLGDEVTLSRSIAIERLSGFATAGSFRAETLNAELTKLFAIQQELRRDIERSIRLSASDAEGGSLAMPTSRASKFLAFDSDGNLIVATGTIGAGAVTITSFAETLLDDVNAASARTTLGLDSNDAVEFGATTLASLKVGDVGTESSGINIGGTTYESTFKVSDIDGTNYAQTILHRHSTTLEPLIVGARSNSNTSAHTDVSAGQNVFSIYGAGWAGSNYKLFGVIEFAADSSGTISNTSSPGKMVFKVTPDASTTPATWMTVGNDKAVVMAGTLEVTNRITKLSMPAGAVIQSVSTQTGAVATGTTTIPDDDTIPQNTEGTEFMTRAITPRSASSLLKITVVMNWAATSNEVHAIALFQDSTANALAAVQCFPNSAFERANPTTFVHYMTAGAATSMTFKVRAGPSASGTLTFNGNGGARKLGGVMASSITIEEIQV